MVTPIFINKNLKKTREFLQEYTLEKFIDLKDDEYLLSLRRWAKRNKSLIEQKVIEYNQQNEAPIEIDLPGKGKMRRLTVLKEHAELETLFPERPWLKEGVVPDFITDKGKNKYFNPLSIGKRLKKLFGQLIKVENYTSIIAGSATFVLTGGNYSLSTTTRSIVKKAVSTLKHDQDWNVFLREAPASVVSSFLFGSGFTAGRLYKIIALGSAQGALQSLATGQDIKTGAMIGAGFNLLNYYVLPYSWTKPMEDGFDEEALKANRYLEFLEKTVRGASQGALVSLFTGENVLEGSLKGVVYGSISSVVTIWFLGTRYNPFKDYSDEEIDDMIAHENEYQNEVGRGGEYNITRQLILDANYRTDGALPVLISASITLPGNVSMGDSGFKKLTTMTHEAHHLMQQHQSGVFGFYLLRYIPAGLKHGYDHHPDENFLRDVLHSH